MKYQKAILCYLDILGFSKFVEQKISNPANVLIAIYHFLLRSMNPTQGYQTVLFSDSLVIIDLLSNENDQEITKSKIQNMLANIADGQAFFLYEKDMVVRGGITIGDIYFEPAPKGLGICIFGPALIKAYEIESKKSDWPRVVIDPCILKYPINFEWILKDEEDNYYLDYLGFNSVPQNYRGLDSFVVKHKDKIIKSLKVDNDKIRNKYKKMAKYHNNIINKMNSNYYWEDQQLQFGDIIIDLEAISEEKY